MRINFLYSCVSASYDFVLRFCIGFQWIVVLQENKFLRKSFPGLKPANYIPENGVAYPGKSIKFVKDKKRDFGVCDE